MAATGTHAHRARPLRAPALTIAALFAAGIALASRAPLGHGTYALAALLLLVTSMLLVWRAPLRYASIAAGALALVSGSLRFAQSHAPPVRAGCPGREAVIWGTVQERDAPGAGRPTFTLDPDSARGTAGVITRGIRLRVTPSGSRARAAAAGAAPGVRVRVEGRLTSLPREGNPGEPSPSAYWRARGVGAEIFAPVITLLDTPGGMRPAFRIALLREAICRETVEAIPGPEGELLKDLLTGERSGVPRETRNAMIDAGVAHILAVSGYRVYVLGAAIGLCLSLIGIRRRLRPFLLVPLLLFYMVLTGSRAPVVRATVMAIVFQAAPACSRRTGTRNALGVAALLILIVAPGQLFDAGFQLSFAAVLTISLYAGLTVRCTALVRGRGPGGEILRSAIRGALLSLLATLGSLPLSAGLFGRVSLIGLLANIPVVPATGLAMVLGIAS
ncbi:MAG TPA: ComEC/Rec2 family competence protein, partial [Bacteroidota bacterium]|nr:ComEC/Rec2 family competence protein [Bacteroidota bacterium]